jgi:hypothetical protein
MIDWRLAESVNSESVIRVASQEFGDTESGQRRMLRKDAGADA